MAWIDFGREVCNQLEPASAREWLATNGIGGFASGTLSGVLTRRYHGLLIAALHPPLGRTLLVAKLDETATFAGSTYPLFTNHWATGVIEPDGYLNLERFYLDGSIPVWVYALAEMRLEKRIWMQPGANTTYVHYTCTRLIPEAGLTRLPIHLSLKTLIDYRDVHGQTRKTGAPALELVACKHGVEIHRTQGRTYFLLSRGAQFQPTLEWNQGFYLSVEAARGESEVEDHLTAGSFEAELYSGETLTIVLSSEAGPELDGEAAYARWQEHDADLLERASRAGLLNPEVHRPALETLALAAGQFIVRRDTPLEPQGCTVIAGYPWFSDWGRDTMISLPGLALATGRPEVARSLLRTFAAYFDQGMLPNRFPDGGETPEYNTVDAALWYFESLRAYLQVTSDTGLLEELFPQLLEAIHWHQVGTRFGIQVDPADGLLYAGEAGVQLTWMDVKIGEWVVTPRTGKAVEINALWYNALCSLAYFARRLGKPEEPFLQAAGQVHKNFQRFWNPDRGCLFDVLDGPGGNDPALRPNQIFAVSLPASPLDKDRQAAVVEACARHLLTSYGLRSLGPGEPGYTGRYQGDRRQRDAAYHQGTVWAWLLGPFTSAHLKVYQNPDLARNFLTPVFHHLKEAGLGTISEIFDGDPPFTPQGCFAQAWSVAEALRAWQEINLFVKENKHDEN